MRSDRAIVSEQLIAAIKAADSSIWIASGHLRHRGISEALMAKARARPELDIRIYLDAQEFISASTHERQLQELEDCLAEASTDSQTRDCLDKGFLFGFEVEQRGVEVRYKWYSYRWHYAYAKQMHHKYMIVDGDELWTGSYNLSATAEHDTFENMVHVSGGRYQDLIDRYEANFLQIWDTGRGEDLLADLRAEIQTAAVIPLVFEPMALEREEVEELKQLIRDNCEQVASNAFRRHPEQHTVCPR